jgi:hypothetical protein
LYLLILNIHNVNKYFMKEILFFISIDNLLLYQEMCNFFLADNDLTFVEKLSRYPIFLNLKYLPAPPPLLQNTFFFQK